MTPPNLSGISLCSMVLAKVSLLFGGAKAEPGLDHRQLIGTGSAFITGDEAVEVSPGEVARQLDKGGRLGRGRTIGQLAVADDPGAQFGELAALEFPNIDLLGA